jgi:hypothetical protein
MQRKNRKIRHESENNNKNKQNKTKTKINQKTKQNKTKNKQERVKLEAKNIPRVDQVAGNSSASAAFARQAVNHHHVQRMRR